MKQIFSLCCLLLGLLSIAQAQKENSHPASWTVSSEKISAGEYKIMVQVKLQDGWAIYSQHLESDEGPVATSFNFEKNDAIAFVGEVEELGERLELFDEIFDMNIVKYKHEVVFVQTVKAKAGTVVKGSFESMVCDNERCLPPRVESFEVKLK